MLRTDHQVGGTEGVDLRRALRRARRRRLFDALEQVYAELPETTCGGCGRCCFESPGLFFVEYLRLVEMLETQRQDVVTRALRELLFSWIEPERNCLFLEEARRCTIYEARPLACRLFGLSSPTDPDQAQEELRLAAEQEAEQLRRLGIEIPEAALRRAVAGCDRVRDTRGRRPRVDPDALAERVAELDAKLIPTEVVRQEYCFLSLPDRLGAAALGGDVVETLRIQVLRRAQRGESVEALVDLIARRK